MKRIISFILLFCMISSGICYAQQPESSALTIDVSQYVNNDIFIMYRNGNYEVQHFDDTQALSEALEALSKNEDILLFQPNYTYNNSAISSSDPLINDQWALDNDGTFYMEEEQNAFPVFDSPFGEGSAPGQWTRPDNFGKPGGRFKGFSYYGTPQPTTAQEGIDINADEAWDIYNGGSRDVIIAMVDTGVDYTHEDLNGRIWTNDDEIAGNGIDDDGNGFIDDVIFIIIPTKYTQAAKMTTVPTALEPLRQTPITIPGSLELSKAIMLR